MVYKRAAVGGLFHTRRQQLALHLKLFTKELQRTLNRGCHRRLESLRRMCSGYIFYPDY
jgi:hypothetical protein